MASSARPLDNSNPTIIAPTAQSSSTHNFSKASQKTKLQRLWQEEGTEELDGFAVTGHTTDVEEDEAEDIDEQEVFGMSCFASLLHDSSYQLTNTAEPLQTC